MDLSLSIVSFPVDEQTASDMAQLVEGLPAEQRTVLHPPLWRADDSRGFAVIAYTDEEKLIGFAAAADMVGLHHYEWSLFVDPDYRRLSLGTALADGVAHALEQRQSESELAAFVDDVDITAFMENLGFRPDFKEILLAADPLPGFKLPAGFMAVPYGGEAEELAALLTDAFDETILPILEHNIEDPQREVWLLKKDQRLIATATLLMEEKSLWVTALAVQPEQQSKGYGKLFLKWCRELAFKRQLTRVLLDVETDNEALHVYEKSGFQRMQTISYWKRETA